MNNLAIRENAIRKCEETRKTLDRLKIDPQSEQRDLAIAELEKSATLWRRELDKVWHV